MKQVSFRSDAREFAALGQGTWKMGVDPDQASKEISVLQEGLSKGLLVIDTAAMYADGGAERIVARAVQGQREKVFIVTKVWPTRADYRGVLQSLEESLGRLETDYVDLFLLHWPSARFPLADTMRAMAEAQRKGLVRGVGVSNFSVELMAEASDALGDVPLVANQVEYSLAARDPETRIIPYCQAHHVTVMAYSPIKNINQLPPAHKGSALLRELAERHATTPQGIALAWTIRQAPVIAIPKSSSVPHLLSNIEALHVTLTSSELTALDRAFPPSGKDMAVERL